METNESWVDNCEAKVRETIGTFELGEKFEEEGDWLFVGNCKLQFMDSWALKESIG